MAGFGDEYLLGSMPGLYDSDTAGPRPAKPSPLLSGLPGIKGDVKLDAPPRLIMPGMTGPTPANANDTKNFTTPRDVPATFSTTPPGTARPEDYEPGVARSRGPVTPELAIAAGFPKEEAQGWADLANWITKGESRRDASAFMELYNGSAWSGGMANHPYALGWPGDRGPDGRPTSAFGLFQDEYGTWQEIAKNYLNGNTSVGPVNQVKGNLLYAADIYKKQTGRNLLADFQSGNIASVEQALHSTWPTLGRRGAAPGDAAFNEYIGLQRRNIAEGETSLTEIMKQARAADPFSAEMKAHLQKAIERSEKMAEHYQALSEHPPQSQTPMEAGGAITPLLVFLAAFGGFATRRPALGAINALSGALQGLKEGNDAQFSNNIDLWKTRTRMAHEAFQMQNESIRNIIDDIQLNETEKQHKLQDAFRFWQMDQDLKLARENNWKEVYERLDQADDKKLERQLLLARVEKTFAEAQAKSEEFKRGGIGLVGNAKALYKTVYDQYVEEHGVPDTKARLELEQKAIEASRTAHRDLTPAQEQKNELIQKDRDYFGMDKLPASFDEDVTTVQNEPAKKMDNEQLTAKGYTPHQIALYNALSKPNLDPSKSPADVSILKRWQNAQTPPFKKPQVFLGEEGQATPTGAAADAGGFTSKEELNTAVKAAKENGEDREEKKAEYLHYGQAFGATEADFDEIWPPEGNTPTGSVAGSQPLPPARSIGLEPQFGM